MCKLNSGERLDDTGFGGIKIIQKPDEFCYGVDAVLLASFAANEFSEKKLRVKKDFACDLGTGTGIVPLVLSHKSDIKRIYGVEFQEASFERAKRNVSINNLHDRFIPIHLDVKNIRDAFKGKAGCFDIVTANPPYFVEGAGLSCDMSAKNLARTESTAGLNEFMEAAAYLLKDKADFYLVHRPSRLPDIFESARKNKLEPKEMMMVVPEKGESANIVLIHFVKNGGKELKILKELAVYEDRKEQKYSLEIERIYERI